MRKQKKLGKSGNISLPLDLRREMHIRVGDPIEIEKQGNEIILRPRIMRCILCEDEKDNVFSVYGKIVCSECAELIKIKERGVFSEKLRETISRRNN